MNSKTQLLFFALLVIGLTGVVLVLSLSVGSTTIPLEDVFISVFSESAARSQTIIWEIRFPRTLSAFVVGALLAMAGALMQVLLRNPLADPYVLGVSGGAAVAALLSMMLGAVGVWVDTSAFFGALLSMVLVFSLAHDKGAWSSNRLLLTGVVIAAGWGAVITLLLSVSNETQLRGMLHWLIGDVAEADLPITAGLVLLLALVLVLPLARDLNVLSRGEDLATTLGLRVQRVRIGTFLLASLTTAVAVSVAGTVGFVGLVIPHLVRLLFGSDNRIVIPFSILLGGTLMMLADILARTLIAPQQLPVGVFTAVLGVPVFLILMRRSYGR
ncbi:MAG: iron ABC transporter permease [Gammaproteobacteria bacterium]|nr:iron ABC transporter permease [Gammaproteobacteria bacterium]